MAPFLFHLPFGLDGTVDRTFLVAKGYSELASLPHTRLAKVIPNAHNIDSGHLVSASWPVDIAYRIVGLFDQVTEGHIEDGNDSPLPHRSDESSFKFSMDLKKESVAILKLSVSILKLSFTILKLSFLILKLPVTMLKLSITILKTL
jgi:hypothetical protein